MFWPSIILALVLPPASYILVLALLYWPWVYRIWDPTPAPWVHPTLALLYSGSDVSMAAAGYRLAIGLEYEPFTRQGPELQYR